MDSFSEHANTLTAPARDAAAITPSDGADLAQTSRAIYVGQSGSLSVVMAGGAQLTFANVPAGSVLPLRLLRVRATGTTASGIVALW